MDRGEIRRIEIDLLLWAVLERYGHDFRKYSRSHIERRIEGFVVKEGVGAISHLAAEILHDEALFGRFLLELSITVSEMFRDPHAFMALREKVIPFLRSIPFIKIWVAGCATGEEAYTLAIVLKEEGLYDKATIFATDFNDEALQKAKEGIYEADRAKQFSVNYHQAGGKSSLADYYHSRYGSILIDQELRKNIRFANHNLATDSIFCEAHLIVCRNVMIYFGDDLKERTLKLFGDSLVSEGFLFVGSNEDLRSHASREHFESVDQKARIYKKLGANRIKGR